MANKRLASEDTLETAGPPPSKKLMTQFEPIKVGPIATLEEMDIKVLQFQNKKLTERIEQRRRAEDELRKRIEQLEQRQSTDDAVLFIINRYWNQLDEDIRVLLQRFDAEGADETEKENESPSVTSFLTLLSQWDQKEIEDKLYQRVEFSKRAIGKLLQAYDRLLQRNEKMLQAVKDKDDGKELEKDDLGLVNISAALEEVNRDSIVTESSKNNEDVPNLLNSEKDSEQLKVKIEGQESTKKETLSPSVQQDSKEAKDLLAAHSTEPKLDSSDALASIKTEDSKMTSIIKPETSLDPTVACKTEKKEAVHKPVLLEVVRAEMDETHSQNKRLHGLVTDLHKTNHQLSLKNSELSDRLNVAETEVAELQNKVEDLEYLSQTATARVEKLDRHLYDAMTKIKTMEEGDIKVSSGQSGATESGVSKRKFEEIYHELEEQKELATTRLSELEKMQNDYQKAKKDIERLKMDLSMLPESVVQDTTEYKVLKSQFSVLYNESMQITQQLEDARTLLQSSKNTHLRQVEQMEGDELSCQKKLRNEMIQLEDQLAQVRRDYENLRIEFEKMLAANEQTGPINREMRHLISSLKSHNEQLKGDVTRYKRKLKETQSDLTKTKMDYQIMERKKEDSVSSLNAGVLGESGKDCLDSNEISDSAQSKKDFDKLSTDKKEETANTSVSKEETPNTPTSKGAVEKTRSLSADCEQIKDLKLQLKKAQDGQKELKLLLDMYKTLPKESRDKSQLMATEKKLRTEIDEQKMHIRKMQETERKEKRKLADDDAIRKIKKLEEQMGDLQKNLAAQKQEEETLLNEMEVTGQAFEDMQEQNIRLLQQLREKDDANFKLMSERIKSNQIHKLLHEEREVLTEQVLTLHTQVEAQNIVVRKLEEKEQILQNNLATVEKELSLRQQSAEMLKRKAVESAQSATDLKLHLDKYQIQIKEALRAVSDKTVTMEQECFKYKRVQEEVASLRKKVDRAKKIEMANSADEVLMEEIREYKEQLTCPSCKVKRKDAILIKCFHVFCLECLKTRYETRQRKCPKCNAAFGAHDYHRIYLE